MTKSLALHINSKGRSQSGVTMAGATPISYSTTQKHSNKHNQNESQHLFQANYKEAYWSVKNLLWTDDINHHVLKKLLTLLTEIGGGNFLIVSTLERSTSNPSLKLDDLNTIPSWTMKWNFSQLSTKFVSSHLVKTQDNVWRH